MTPTTCTLTLALECRLCHEVSRLLPTPETAVGCAHCGAVWSNLDDLRAWLPVLTETLQRWQALLTTEEAPPCAGGAC